jgi:hypothetical protein
VYIPFHSVEAAIRWIGRETEMTHVRLAPIAIDKGPSNIDATASELVIRGPGLVQLTGFAWTEKNLVGPLVPLEFLASFRTSDDQDINLSEPLLPSSPAAGSTQMPPTPDASWRIAGHRRLPNIQVD